MPGQPLGEIERARPPHVMFEVIVELGLKQAIGARLVIGRLDGEDQRHQGLGDKPPTIDAEMTALVGAAAETVRNLHLSPFRFRTMPQRATHRTGKTPDLTRPSGKIRRRCAGPISTNDLLILSPRLKILRIYSRLRFYTTCP